MSAVAGVGFLIVGTPRSGTTLVQRLACELDGVRMPPETHFFGFFALDLLARKEFPLAGAALREELEAFASMDKSAELGLDVDAVERLLGGRCASLGRMFDAIVESLAGPAEVLGEKSPEHLLWWRRLTEAAPATRIVGVIRDPRAVVASAIAVWGDRGSRHAPPHVMRAQRWASDARELARAAATLGPARFLLLRYEDVVRDEGTAREAVAAFLGRRVAVGAIVGSPDIVMPREWWKERTFMPITDERVEAWRASLTNHQASEVAAICRSGMRRFGYATESRRRALARIASLSPRANAERLRFVAGRTRHGYRIARATI